MILWITLLLFLFSGCSTSKSSPPLEIPLVPFASVEESTSFEKALALPPASKEVERTRIEYLLERIAKSPYNFIRNGTQHSGKRAQIHLRWKYLRNQKKAATAEQFINDIATRSKISGEKYLVVLPDKRRIPLQNFLVHELHSFNESLEEKHRENL